MSLNPEFPSRRSKELAVAALDFCDDMLQGSEVIFIAGSVARGRAHKDSDVDVVIIVPGRNPHIEIYDTDSVWQIQCARPEYDGGIVANLMFAASDSIEPWLHYCRGNPTVPFMLHMIATGVLLRDQDGYGRSLQRHVQGILEKGPIHLSEEEYQAEVSHINDLTPSVADPLAVKVILHSLYYLAFTACGLWPGLALHLDGTINKAVNKYLPKSMEACIADIQGEILRFPQNENYDVNKFTDWIDAKLTQIDEFHKNPPACPLRNFKPVIQNIAALLP